jgi:glycosyltransferase involved in cell wall biosynthesis
MAESCDRIVRSLERSGVAVDLVHFDRRISRPQFRATEHGSKLRWPADPNAAHTINCVWNRIRQELDLDRTTQVIAFGGALPIVAAPAFAAWIDRPLVTLLRGNELDTGLFDPRRRPLLDDALRRSAVICTVTTEQADKVAALEPQLRTRMIANGIDFDLWQATDADRERAASWRLQNVAPNRRVVGLFGHLKAKKGVPFFLDVLRRSGLAERFHVLLVGEAEEGITVDTQVTTVDRFDLIPFYLACDFIALPSHYDGFPNVLIEAAALGIPALASNVGGMRDLCTDGENALLFEPGDFHGARRALTRAASLDPGALRRMGTRAEAVVRERCDAVDEGKRYVEVLDAAARVRRVESAG